MTYPTDVHAATTTSSRLGVVCAEMIIGSLVAELSIWKGLMGYRDIDSDVTCDAWCQG
jgi:hypothetical protein